MPRLRARPPSSSSNFVTYLGPITIGAGYTGSKILMIHWWDPALASQIDLKLMLLSGVLIGVTIRPLVQRIYWHRTTSFLIMSLVLLLMGPPGAFPEHLLWKNDWETVWWLVIMPDLLPSFVVAGLASLLITPRQFQLTLKDFFALLHPQHSPGLFLRFPTAALAYVGIYLLTRSIFNWFEGIPLIATLQSFLEPGPVWNQNLIYLWIRGCFLVLALFPFCQILRGSLSEMTLILGIFLFMVSDFAPQFSRISGLPTYELMDQVIQRLFIDVIFCYITVLLLSKGWIQFRKS